jgi:hypothetical protein
MTHLHVQFQGPMSHYRQCKRRITYFAAASVRQKREFYDSVTKISRFLKFDFSTLLSLPSINPNS